MRAQSHIHKSDFPLGVLKYMKELKASEMISRKAAEKCDKLVLSNKHFVLSNSLMPQDECSPIRLQEEWVDSKIGKQAVLQYLKRKLSFLKHGKK